MKISGVRLILHPGMPKCGSSSIQASLISNLQELKFHNIFILDKNFRIREFSTKADPHGIPYSIIFEFLDGEKNLEEEMKKICKYIKETYHIDSFDLVLSSEVLSFITTERGYKFHKLLSDLFDDILVIMVIRSPWSQLLSNWRQGVYRTGLSFEDYTKKYLSEGETGDYWESRIEAFTKIYDEVKLLSLDTSDNIIKDFYNTFIEKNLNIKSNKINNNRSLSPIFCEIMSHYPSLFQDEIKDTRNTIKRHKNILDKISKSDSIIFSNDCFPIHIELLDKLKEIFSKNYFNLLSKYGNYTPEELEEKKTNILRKSHIKLCKVDINNISNFMLAEVVSSLKRIQD